MLTTELGDTILEREFDSIDADGNKSIITFRLGVPFKPQDATGLAQWRCNYQITGMGLEKVHFAMGVDAIDALTTCLQLGDIFIRSYQKRRMITFFGKEDLHLVPCSVKELSEEERKAMREDENSPFKQVFDEFFRNFHPEQKPLQPPEQSDQAE